MRKPFSNKQKDFELLNHAQASISSDEGDVDQLNN